LTVLQRSVDFRKMIHRLNLETDLYRIINATLKMLVLLIQ